MSSTVIAQNWPANGNENLDYEYDDIVSSAGSFTGNGGKLTSVKLDLHHFGTWAIGDVEVRVYSGSSVVATSLSKNNQDLSSFQGEVVFDFVGGQQLQTVAGQAYVLRFHGMGLWDYQAGGSGFTVGLRNGGLAFQLYGTAPATVALLYNGNGHTSGSVPTDSSSPYNPGSTVTVLGQGSLLKSGYSFLGWSTNSSASSATYTQGSTFTISSNTTLYAVWQLIPTFTVTYNGNGHTSGSAPTDSNSPYQSGATVTVLGQGSLLKSGYSFLGWSTNISASSATYTQGSTFTVSQNTTLYAVWSVIPPQQYTVSYNGNGHTGGSAPVDGSSPYNGGATVTVLGKGTLTKTNYVFTGWATTSGGVVAYTQGQTFTISANTTLYAVWVAARTLTYNGNGNTGGSAPVDGSSPYPNGATVTVLGQGTLTKTNYAFTGWATTSSGSVTYTVGQTFTISADVTLYAVWVALRTLTYNGNGHTSGSAPVDTNSPYVSGSLVVVLGQGSLVKSGGYNFLGWATTTNATSATYTAGSSFAINSNTVLYAVWSTSGGGGGFNAMSFP